MHHRHRRAPLGLVATSLLVAASASVSVSVLAQEPAAPPQPVGILGAASGTGPWPAVAESDATLLTHVLYRPATMPADELPLVVWGNGACADNGLAYGAFLREVASHGYFVISLGYPRAERLAPPTPPAPGAAPAAPPPTAARRVDPTQAAQMLEAIDWATAQTGDRQSRFHDKIDVSRIAVAGHSCGALQAIKTAADPRVTTTLVLNSGVIAPSASNGPMGIRVTKDELRALRGPVIYLTGGPTDIAHGNAVDDVSRIEHVPVFFAFNEVGHGGTYWTAPNGGDYADVAVDWLDWRLKGDAHAARTFLGTSCALCGRSGWTVAKQPSQ